jgi:serine/threonine protein kinase
MYAEGLGVPADAAVAANYFNQTLWIALLSQHQKDSSIFYLLGLMYQFGRGVTKDMQRARQYYEQGLQLPALDYFYKNKLQKRLKQLEAMAQPLALSESLGKLSISFAILPQALQLGRKLGQGTFGVVYHGHYQGGEVAIKQLLQQQLDATSLEAFQQEFKLMAQLRSPHIVYFYGICTQEPYSLVMEYMPKGSLYQVLHSQETLSANVCLQLAIDTGKGLAYLHAQSIIHRDVKSLNVLVDNHYHAKLTDFGLAKTKSVASSTTTGHAVGSLYWMAPELFKRGIKPDYASDMYSYGMVLWEIVTREHPWKEASNAAVVSAWVMQGERETIPEKAPVKFKEVIKHCWFQDPKQRISAQAAVALLAEEATTARSTDGVNQEELQSGPQYAFKSL